VQRITTSHRSTNDKVSELKKKRNRAQKEAGAVLSVVKEARDSLATSGKMVNLDPHWKKEKLLDELGQIENSIQTSALDHKAERKLLDRRKKLLEENDRWLKSRRESNPEMATFIDSRSKMNTLYRKADNAHRRMIEIVEKAQPMYEKKVSLTAELREIRRQLDRARELLSQSDYAIAHWERRLKDGFGELERGFPDLMAANIRVSNGGRSSFARNSKSKKGGDAPRGVEE
jgi:uncharacterized coiled-coil DUF342 family protein